MYPAGLGDLGTLRGYLQHENVSKNCLAASAHLLVLVTLLLQCLQLSMMPLRKRSGKRTGELASM